ncbi:MAG: SDR family NAD(P)-dependent oxidoreductase [Ectothiorhodospiraceae bacterium]|nr:SDR family NAD(P)-dependent oxidoreductase [Ectothiorhodospiraceae bacterium]
MQRDPRPVALITGAGSGIGRALAIEGARRGRALVLVGRRTSALAETATLCDQPCLQVGADLTTAGGRAEVVRVVAESVGRLDLLLNNAGVVAACPFAETSDAALERMVALNLVAPAALTRDLLPWLRRGSAPRVVNVGSMFGDIAFPMFAGYSATKFGLRGLSDALRRELAGDGIGVTYAAPRATATPAADGFAHLIEPMRMRLDAPERVAARIWRAAERGARSVYPRGPEMLFVAIQRLFPALVDRDLRKLAMSPELRPAVTTIERVDG